MVVVNIFFERCCSNKKYKYINERTRVFRIKIHSTLELDKHSTYQLVVIVEFAEVVLVVLSFGVKLEQSIIFPLSNPK